MKNKNRVGEKHITNQGCNIEIIEYFSSINCTIQFDNGLQIKKLCYGQIKSGAIKNPFYKSSYGVGYLGVGKYDVKIYFKIYNTWKSLLGRCYNNKWQKRKPTYIGCTVDEKWHNFQVFAQWYKENYKENSVLDKDILIKGNKIYSPETCCFVPHQINGLFTKANTIRGKYPIGVSKMGNRFVTYMAIKNKQMYISLSNTPEEAFQAYKTTKEKHIKDIAEEYRDQITDLTYQALINYKVEITD
jgi:hypothetical protein